MHATVDEVVAAIERGAPGSAAQITVDGGMRPFPDEVDATAFAEVVGKPVLTPLDEGVAETIAFFTRQGARR